MPLLNRLEVSAGDDILPFHLINRCATSSKLARHFRAGCSVSGAWHLWIMSGFAPTELEVAPYSGSTANYSNNELTNFHWNFK